MDYKIVKYSEIGKIRSGKRLPKGYTVSEETSDNKYIRVRDISNGSIDSSIVQYITDEAAKKLERYRVKTRDVIISVVGTVGAIAQIDESLNGAYLTENCDNLQVDEFLCLKDYLKYYLLSEDGSKEIIANTVGSTQPKLPIYGIENFNIKLPNIDNQKKIVKLLNSIDIKIKLNNEINNNLYEVSKQLLLKYLNENNNFEEVNISELLNVFTGKKNANETSPTGKYKFFSCAPENLLSDTYLYDGAAIIVAGNGAYTGRTRFYDGKFELYQRTYGLTLKDGFDKDNIYGLYVFMKTLFEPDKMGGTHGSAIPYIVLSDLTDYKLKYNKTEFDKFSNLVSSNIKMIQENEKYNEELSELRDTLLPKLMNGEIDLDNIEI